MSRCEGVLGLIPARGGSKGIPRKTLRPFGGRPLIAHTIQASLSSESVTETVVSTDDEEIARVAREYGAAVPFLRPAHLATDVAPQIDVVLHAVGVIESARAAPYEIVVLLQPTSPLRTAADIDAAVAVIRRGEADSVVSFSPAFEHPYYAYTIGESGPKPFIRDRDIPSVRQLFPPAYVRNGAIYATRRELLETERSLQGGRVHAYVMSRERAPNIDTELDLAWAEFLLQHRADSREG